jgi:polyisoprenoid-binding protein YceI
MIWFSQPTKETRMNHFTKLMMLAAAVALFVLAGCAAPLATAPTEAAVRVTQAPITTEPTTPSMTATTTPTETAPTAPPADTQPTNPPPGDALPAENTGNLQFTIVTERSQANYRVREQLASLTLPNDAVGVTNTVSGTITIQPDGAIVASESQIVVDVSNLTSDNSRRDNYVRRNTLQTDQYPQVTFAPKEVTGLPSPLPESGEIAFQLSGDLTIRDVTRPVIWEITGQIQDGQITARATTTFTFAEFNITQPRVPVVLSVEDNITLEADLVLQR